MMWYEILCLCVFLFIVVGFSIFLIVIASKEQVTIQEVRKWQVKFYKTFVEVYSNDLEKK